MDILDEISARNNLIIVFDQLSNNIKQIEEKTPNRTDYIVPMKESKNRLAQSIVIFDELRNELKLYKTHSANLMLNLQLRDAEIEKLKAKNDEIMKLL